MVLVRDGDRTVLTMANDYRGDPQEFALVVPVPTVLEKRQIHVGKPAIIDHLDAFTAPRLVEYYDRDPCAPQPMTRLPRGARTMAPVAEADEKGLGVTVEAEYSVGEYDIVILSAEQSTGLEAWLTDNGYSIPEGAAQVLGSYIKQDLKFFVAKVDLETQEKLGFQYLRPLQMAYESPRFMLPIRLGTVNADGPQELFVFALTRKGRVETTNYRTVKLPTDAQIPVFVKDRFGDFYQAMFREQAERRDKRAVFLEYAWDMGWCDPCAADPLSRDELRELGVFWLDGGPPSNQGIRPPQPTPRRRGLDVYVTRLHLRYTAETFPEDLRFQVTGNRDNFQGRYVLRHPWEGEARCEAAERYLEQLPQRRDKRAQRLASLTGWDIGDIREKMALETQDGETDEVPWWRRLWGDDGEE